MNTAELTAWNFYKTYHLDAMPSEVKRHLMILLLRSPHTTKGMSYEDLTNDESFSGVLAEPEPFSWNEVNRRLDQAEADMGAGRTMSCEAVHVQLEQNFPWLCE